MGTLGLSLLLWFGRGRHWGRFRFRVGSFSPAGRDARPFRMRPRLGSGLFWLRLGAWLRRVAVVKDAVCRSLSLTGSVHTSKLVRVFLQAGGAKFECVFRVRGPGFVLCCGVMLRRVVLGCVLVRCVGLCRVVSCGVLSCRRCCLLLRGGWLRGVVFCVVVWRYLVACFGVLCRVGGVVVLSRVSFPRGVV